MHLITAGVRLQPFKGDQTVLSKLLVVGVVEGSLADRHGNPVLAHLSKCVFLLIGICENDEILLINDTAVTQLTLSEVKTAFKGTHTLAYMQLSLYNLHVLFISFCTNQLLFLITLIHVLHIVGRIGSFILIFRACT